MFCTHCGCAVESHARFCSKCGVEVTAEARAASQVAPTTPALPQKPKPDMNMHVNILGWLLVGSGILTAILALVILFAGQVVRHVPVPLPPGLPHFIGWLTTLVGLVAMTLAAGVAAAGVGLLQHSDWARVLTIVISVFLLFHFPIGTVIAIYAFWVLFSKEGQEYYKTTFRRYNGVSGT